MRRRTRTTASLVLLGLLVGGCATVERVAGRRAAEEARWALDPTAEVGPEATELPLLVEEVACASGRDAGGRISATVDGDDDTVVITVHVEPLPGDQNCPSNPLTPYLLDLGEPLGERTLVNGAESEIARRPVDLPGAGLGSDGPGAPSMTVEGAVPEPAVFLAEALLVRARDHAELAADVTDLSPDPAGVELYLGAQLVATRTPEELRDPDAWVLPVPDFAGYTGPFSALEQLGTADLVTLAAGAQPHCAGPARPSPTELADLDRYALRPAEAVSCLQWFVVNLYVDGDGALRAVQLDLWEP